MIVKAKIIQGKYLDSVRLMLISQELRKLQEIKDAVAIVANKENRQILADTGMLVPEISSALETDIVIVIKAADETSAQAALIHAEALISEPTKSQTTGMQSYRSIRAAASKRQDLDLCLISVAGKYAAREAAASISEGLHVMIFSDNVSMADELRLKQEALAKGLLMMGPDCGTAIINGCPLGFANHVPAGEIGIVSASGTGLQEVSVAIAHRGMGISQAFGTGGRDGKAEIGGLMLSATLDYLINDPDTKVILMIAKTPDPEVRERLWTQIATTAKPVVVNFLKPLKVPKLPNMFYTHYLDHSAELACRLVQGFSVESIESDTEEEISTPKIGKNRKYIVGLYSGGTLCYEAQQLYYETFGQYPPSNTPIDPACICDDPFHGRSDRFIDLGSDEFTVGRAHPMIDFSLRMKLLEHVSAQPDTAAILIDVVLGYGSHPDPAGEIVPILRSIDPGILVVCNVLGTESDPQNAIKQVQILESAGASVFTSHHTAASYALRALQSHRRMP